MENRARKEAGVSGAAEWDQIDLSVERIVVPDNSFNEASFTETDFSPFVNLREISIGSDCFKNVVTVNITGLPRLINVTIGVYSFTTCKGCASRITSRRFYLTNCPLVTRLFINHGSFSDYGWCVIKNNTSFSALQMGSMDGVTWIFNKASLVVMGLGVGRR